MLKTRNKQTIKNNKMNVKHNPMGKKWKKIRKQNMNRETTGISNRMT